MSAVGAVLHFRNSNIIAVCGERDGGAGVHTEAAWRLGPFIALAFHGAASADGHMGQGDRDHITETKTAATSQRAALISSPRGSSVGASSIARPRINYSGQIGVIDTEKNQIQSVRGCKK